MRAGKPKLGKRAERFTRAQAMKIWHEPFGGARWADLEKSRRSRGGGFRFAGQHRGLARRACDENRRHRVDGRRDSEMAQRGLGNPLEDRRGDDAAVVALSVRRVDDDEYRQRRAAGRHEADKRRVILRRRVAPADDFRGGARFSRNLIAGKLRSLCGTALDDRFHDSGQRRRRFGVHRARAGRLARDATRRPSRTTARTMRGRRSSPPLATALAAAAIWSGVMPI